MTPPSDGRFDAADDAAAGVGRGAGNRELCAGEIVALFAGAVMVDVGAAVSVGRGPRHEARLHRRRLRAHVRQQIQRRLLHPHVARPGAGEIVIAVEAPLPLLGAGAEDERAARRR